MDGRRADPAARRSGTRRRPRRARLRACAQARRMHDLLERTAGDVAMALATYNAGPAALAREWPRETRAYVARVMRRFGGPAVFSGEMPLSLADAGAAKPARYPEVRLLP